MWATGCDRNETPDEVVSQAPESPADQEVSDQNGASEQPDAAGDEQSDDDTSDDGDRDGQADAETAPDGPEASPDEDQRPGWRDIEGEYTCDGDWCRLAPDINDLELRRVSRVDDELVVAGRVGDSFDGESFLFRYDGSRWQALAAPEEMSFRRLQPVSTDEIYAIGKEHGQFEVLAFDGDEWSTLRKLRAFPGFLETWSGGRLVVNESINFVHRDGTSWEQKGSGNELMGRSLAFGPEDILAFGTEIRGEIWHFDGDDWEKQYDARHVGRPGDAWANGRDDIYVVGEGLETFVVHYDGEQWNPMEMPPPESPGSDDRLRGVWGTGAGDVFAVGDHGVIYHYDGTAWHRQQSPVETNLIDVAGFGPDRVYAVGADGVVLEYAGERWRSIEPPTDATLRNVWTTEDGKLFVLGREAIIRFDASTSQRDP